MKPKPEGFQDSTAPVTFDIEQLWLLQGFCRHEMQGQREWQKPPADLEFNELITDAILACAESGLTEYTLPLTLHHCLIIDALVPNSAKTASGANVGRPMLLKAYKARRELRGERPVFEVPRIPNVVELMAEFEYEEPAASAVCEHCGGHR